MSSLVDCAKKQYDAALSKKDYARIIKERPFEAKEQAESAKRQAEIAKRQADDWFERAEKEYKDASKLKEQADKECNEAEEHLQQITKQMEKASSNKNKKRKLAPMADKNEGKSQDAEGHISNDIIECPVCRDEFRSNINSSNDEATETASAPVTGNCGHTVCKACLNNTHLQRLEGRPNVRYIKCPCCEDKVAFDVQKLSLNIVMCNMICEQNDRSKARRSNDKDDVVVSSETSQKAGKSLVPENNNEADTHESSLESNGRINIEYVRTLLDTPGTINCIAKVDSDEILVGSCNQTLQLWNVGSGEIIRTYMGHKDEVNDIVVINKNRFISCSSDNTIKLWNIASVNCEHTFKGHSYDVCSIVKISKSRFISASKDKTIKLWNVTRKKYIRTYNVEVTVWAIARTGGQCFLSGDNAGTIKLWDGRKSNVLIRSFKGHNHRIISICVFNDKKSFISGSKDRIIRLWNIKDGTCTRTYDHGIFVESLAIISNGWFASASNWSGGKIKLWNIYDDTDNCKKIIDQTGNVAGFEDDTFLNLSWENRDYEKGKITIWKCKWI